MEAVTDSEGEEWSRVTHAANEEGEMGLKTFRRACGLGVAAVLVAAVAHAQPSDKRTLFTFSRPITLPGVTLPAGKYVFRLADDQTSRKVIQVTSSDGTKPYAMLLTVSDERRDPPKDAEVSFMETAGRTPSAVRAWWYPGERTGYEFIYPRAQARQLAQSTGTSVLTTKADTTKAEETRTGDLTRVDSSGRDQDAATAADNASSQRESGSVAQNVPQRTPPQSAQAAPSASPSPVPNPPPVARNTLPQTASQLSLVGLIGMLSLVGFSSVRLWRTNR
jgi:hypothetical protein